MNKNATDASQYYIDVMRTYVKNNLVKVGYFIIVFRIAENFQNEFEKYIEYHSRLGQCIFEINGYR